MLQRAYKSNLVLEQKSLSARQEHEGIVRTNIFLALPVMISVKSGGE